MTLYAVQKDVPITVYVEAEDEDAAKERADFAPVWDRLYGRMADGKNDGSGFDSALGSLAIVGFPYDDIDVEEQGEDDIPAGVEVQT